MLALARGLAQAGPSESIHGSTPNESEVHLNQVCIAVVAISALVTAAPLAAQTDEWFARDKALHFGASAVIAIVAYGAAATHYECRQGRLAVGGATALLAGIGKEMLDRAGHGEASWKDLAWDVLGTTTGLAIAVLADGPDTCATGGLGPGTPEESARALRGPWVSPPPSTAPTERGAAAATSTRIPPPPYGSGWFDRSLAISGHGPSSFGSSADARPRKE